MKIPKKVKIGGRIFKVEIVESLPNDVLGETVFTKLSIQIKKGNKLQMEKTFLHEICHCFVGTFSEFEVDTIANHFHAFIKDNKGVLNE